MTDSLIKNSGGDGIRLDVTPDSAGWRFLSFAVVKLTANATHADQR